MIHYGTVSTTSSMGHDGDVRMTSEATWVD